MTILKKLIFAPIFLISFFILIYNLAPFLSSYDFIFSLSLDSFINFLILSGLIILSSFLFLIFATLASDWRISLPVGIISSFSTFLFLDMSYAFIFTAGLIISFLLISLSINSTLKNYLTFKPASLLNPSIRNLSTLLIISFCVVYFLSVSKIAQEGFQIPDSLIDTALKMSPVSAPSVEQTPLPTQLPQITPEQIELLKQNPDLLRQYGLNPEILDTLTTQESTPQSPQEFSNNLIKQTIKDQMQDLLNPYISFIPAILALLLFFTLISIVSLLNILIYPLIWLTFLILEKTGFTKFTIEMREVKKMVV